MIRSRASRPNHRRRANRHRVNLFGLLLLCWVGSTAQPAKPVLTVGEEIKYGAYYNWKFIWVNAGEVLFRTDTIGGGEQKQWRLRASILTYKAYDLVMTVRDTFETHLSYPEFQPLRYSRSINHGSSISRQSYQVNQQQGIADYFHKKGEQDTIKSKFAWPPNVYDLLSQAYLFRSYKFEQLKTDEIVHFPLVVDDRIDQFWFRYQGREVVKSRDGRKFNCHKILVWLVEGEFFPKGEFMRMWFTADSNHIPIMVETKVHFGSVKAIFLNAKSLPYPLNSEIY